MTEVARVIESQVESAREEARLLAQGWPPALVKACGDSSWLYAAGLRTGGVIVFEGARPQAGDGTWVHLTGIQSEGTTIVRGLEMERGLDVRVSDIMWALDSGH